MCHTRSERTSIRDIIIEKIRGVQLHRSRLKNIDGDNPSFICAQDNGHLSSESDFEYEINEIFHIFIATFVVVGVLRYLFCVKKEKRTVYMMRSANWRDEEGLRVAVAASLPANSHLRGTAKLIDKEMCMESKDKKSAEGDLWMLLMSE